MSGIIGKNRFREQKITAKIKSDGWFFSHKTKKEKNPEKISRIQDIVNELDVQVLKSLGYSSKKQFFEDFWKIINSRTWLETYLSVLTRQKTRGTSRLQQNQLLVSVSECCEVACVELKAVQSFFNIQLWAFGISIVISHRMSCVDYHVFWKMPATRA